MRIRYLIAVLTIALLLGGCSSTPAQSHEQHAQAQTDQSQLHTHGSSVSKLGLQPAVLDNVQEVVDVARIEDGKLIEVDLLNTMGALHGIFAIPSEGTVLITIEGKNVAWSDKPTDYPVSATIPGPVRREGPRLRMSAEQLEKLFAVYFPNGKVEVRDGKLQFTTGR